MEIRRGDVVICAAPGEYGKPRPALVVQSELFNGTHSSVTVCLITSHLEDAPPYRFPVPAGRTTGLKVQSQVMVDKVIAIPRNKITSQVIPCSSRLSFLLLRRARALRLPLLGFSFQLGLQLFGMCGVEASQRALTAFRARAVASAGSRYLRLFRPPFLPSLTAALSTMARV